MKTLSLAVIISSTTLISHSASADQFYDYARVTKVKPVYQYVEHVTPVEHCRTIRRKDATTSTIAGATIGGVIGNVLTRNSRSGKRDVATVAGAIIGGAIGNDAGQNHYRTSQHCEVSYEEVEQVREIRGYRVHYAYNGETFSTFMQRDPGKKIKVRVKVAPAFAQ